MGEESSRMMIESWIGHLDELKSVRLCLGVTGIH